uniref:Protein kinase domain-containing protein n=1 Tax=Hemiselmis andersenii TaxID=464988 RepID=A0A6U4VGF2_HEMAN|mmetsp:Transcript_9493/g.22211  ORF Transcript_9493/g.22211 Transcript_9493/m.22211 type:complete len:367 (-) Transcript_9493:990-2090(-)
MDPGTLDRTGSPRPPRPPPTALWPPSDDEDEEEAVEYESSKTGDIEGAYEFTTQVLGKGSVAVVRSAVNIQTKEAVAIKIVPKKKCEHDGEKSIRQEIAVLQRLHHPNCIEFREVYETDAFIFIVMEQVNGGEMLDRIMEKSVYSETEAATAFVQMIAALDYIHSIGIAHRDMKPDNILYKSTDPDSPIKLADFGHASLNVARAGSGAAPQSNPMQTFVGTPIYVAPEVLQRNGYGKECDVWSAGVIVYILLCGCPPFNMDATVPQIYQQILAGDYEFPEEFWEGISDEAKDLVTRMLCMDVSKRITCRECLEHPWLAKFHQGDLPKTHITHFKNKLQEFRKMKVASVRDRMLLMSLGIDSDFGYS